MSEKEYLIKDEELKEVSGGNALSPTNEETAAFEAALNKVNGKTCKFCKKVFSKDAVMAYYQNRKFTLYKYAIKYEFKAVPCISCGYWRFVDSDFN